MRGFSLFILLCVCGESLGQSHEQDTIVAYLLKLKKTVSIKTKEISDKSKKKRDSLVSELEKLKDDSLLVDAYERLRMFYDLELEDYENAWNMSKAILAIANRTGNKYYYSLAHNGFGLIWYIKGNYLEAIKEYELALATLAASKIVQKIKIESEGRLLGNIGASFQLMNDLDNGLSYHLRSIEKLLLVKDSAALSITYYNVSYICSDINQWQQSYFYLSRAINYLIRDFYSDVVVLSRAASVCIQLNKMREARSFLERAKRYELSDQNNLADLNYYCALGQYEFKARDQANAEKHLKQAYQTATIYGDPYWVAVQARELGLLYMATKDYKSASHFFFIAKDVATEFAYQPQVLQSFSDLSDLARARGQMSEALMYKTRQISYSDSLVKKQNHNRILYYNAKFEADKKQNEIIQLQKDNEIKNLTIQQSRLWLYFSFTGMLAFVIVGLLVYFNMQHKQNLTKQKSDLQLQQIRELEKDKQLTLADAILKGQEQERARLAKDLHDGLGGLLSGVKIALSNLKGKLTLPVDQTLSFDRSLDMLDSSIQELRRVSHNMMPESLVKFGLVAALRDFSESINTMKAAALHFQLVGERRVLDVSHETIVYRIVQELVNNALKHSGAKNIIIQLMYQSNSLSVTVEDDGNGFDVEAVKNAASTGWANVQSRISYLKGKLDVTSHPYEGTSVHIFLTV